ncbi:hypothetical protein ACP70R_020320 [Stipagrostis hirtigluma subsp. patula]
MKTLFVISFLILLYGAHHVESRRHPNREPNYKLFVFGDSFVDVGNEAESELSQRSRAWYYPYEFSDSDHDNRATGRFSNDKVQSDYVVRILGLDASPPPYRTRKSNEFDPSGENFAAAGAGVFDWPEGAPSFSTQVNQLSRLVSLGMSRTRTCRTRPRSSPSLPAATSTISTPGLAPTTWVMDLCEKVTDAIVDGVRRLQKLGVPKVLVNAMPPIGCSPYRTFPNNRSSCEISSNADATVHNALLKQKLGDEDDVLLLDLNTLFTDIIDPKPGSALSRHRFKHKFTPCCDDTMGTNGYCGQVDSYGNPMYTLCSNPDNFFFWDYIHQTQAGWKAIMELLQGSILDFLSPW